MERERVVCLVEQSDNFARQELFAAFYQRTFGVVYHILRNRENAEDITQEAFVKAFQNMSRLREPAKFGAWLAAIASNLARNHLKKEKRLLFTGTVTSPAFKDSAVGAEEQALKSLEVAKVREALTLLPPEQYQVVVLQYFYDLKIEDIAAMLKISPGTVKSRLFRARQKLLQALEPDREVSSLLCKGGEETDEPR